MLYLKRSHYIKRTAELKRENERLAGRATIASRNCTKARQNALEAKNKLLNAHLFSCLVLIIMIATFIA